MLFASTYDKGYLVVVFLGYFANVFTTITRIPFPFLSHAYYNFITSTINNGMKDSGMMLDTEILFESIHCLEVKYLVYTSSCNILEDLRTSRMEGGRALQSRTNSKWNTAYIGYLCLVNLFVVLKACLPLHIMLSSFCIWKNTFTATKRRSFHFRLTSVNLLREAQMRGGIFIFVFESQKMGFGCSKTISVPPLLLVLRTV